ncbi:hypothetical protein [Neorhizobium sp. LjRoot104]
MILRFILVLILLAAAYWFAGQFIGSMITSLATTFHWMFPP